MNAEDAETHNIQKNKKNQTARQEVFIFLCLLWLEVPDENKDNSVSLVYMIYTYMSKCNASMHVIHYRGLILLCFFCYSGKVVYVFKKEFEQGLY